MKTEQIKKVLSQEEIDKLLEHISVECFDNIKYEPNRKNTKKLKRKIKKQRKIIKAYKYIVEVLLDENVGMWYDSAFEIYTCSKVNGNDIEKKLKQLKKI